MTNVIVNASNIQVQGTRSGFRSISAPNIGAEDELELTASGASRDLASIFLVEVIDYGVCQPARFRRCQLSIVRRP